MSPARVDQADILTSWILQTAIIGAFALSTLGITIALRRPAMRQLCAIWGLYVLAAVAGLAGSWMSTAAAPGILPLLLASASTAFVLASGPANVLLIDALAGRSNRWARRGVVTTLVFVAAFAVVGVGSSELVPWLSQSYWPRFWTSRLYVGCSAQAFRFAMASPSNRRALVLIGAGFGLMGARVIINVIFAATVSLAGTSNAGAIALTMSQVFSIVLFGTVSLFAVLEEERSEMLTKSETLRNAEISLAASRRMESLGRLAAGITHDVNNILTAISAGATFAREAAHDPNQLVQELTMVDDAVARATDLIRRLQLFTRDQSPEPVVFDVGQRLDSLTAMLARVIGGRATLSVSRSATPLTVRMDPSRLEQVILNLVVNARDAMPDGGTIQIQTEYVALTEPCKVGDTLLAVGDYVRISVTDSGSGIPPEILAKVFEPFFTTKDGVGGTGIGLATCQSIVLEAGGAIDVHSESGRGSRFDVCLPLAQ